MTPETVAAIIITGLVMLLVGYWIARLTVQRAIRNELPETIDFAELQAALAKFTPPQVMESRAPVSVARMDYDALRAELEQDPQNLGYAALGQDYAAIAALLNRRPQRIVNNPQPQGRVPKPLTMNGFMSLLTSDEALKVYSIGTLKAGIERTIRQDKRAELVDIIRSVHGMFSSDTQWRIRDFLLETEPDPAWTVKVVVNDPSRITQLGLPEAQPTDIQQVW